MFFRSIPPHQSEGSKKVSSRLHLNRRYSWLLEWWMYKMVPHIQGVYVAASVYSLIAVSVDRTVQNKMDAAIDMYYFTASPPSRAVLLLARALGMALNLKLVNIMAGEQMQPDFLKMNPMHSVPTMDDNGFILWESRPIMQYLVDQYDKQGKLTFTDPKQRATINLMLYFDSGTLFQRLASYFFPVMVGAEKPNNEKREKVEEALQVFDQLLGNNEWAAGDRMSIADFSLIASVSTAEAVQIDISKHERVMAWYQRTKKALAPTGYEEINQKGADMIAQGFEARMKSS